MVSRVTQKPLVRTEKFTDQDSCLNGFQDLNTDGKVTAMVTGHRQNVCKLISNALALVNKFAATGGGYK